MSISSYINSPSYVAPSTTIIPANVQSFYNSPNVQAYLNNNPTTSYTISNLYNNTTSYAFDAQTIPISSGRQYIQILQSIYDVDPANVSILDLTIPAGSYNVYMQGVINCANSTNTYINTAELLLYNRAGGDANVSCPLGLMTTSSQNNYNYVADANVFLILKGYQKIELTADTVVSMVLRVTNVSSISAMYYGASSNGVSLTSSITFTPTI
nr:MAG: hypothetical protein [Lake Baikal virophage 5]